VIEFMWKDQGWGNQKGHIWARVTGEIEHASVRISPHAAPHEWTQESLSLPAHWFDFSAGSARLELAYEVGAGGGHSLYLALGATLTLEPRLPELHVFDPAAAELEATASEGGELLIGDCLEVRDTHGLWSVARIVACIDDEQNGPLALVHFEGWSASWLMWLSRAFDLQHVRPLGELRGIGSRRRRSGRSCASRTSISLRGGCGRRRGAARTRPTPSPAATRACSCRWVVGPPSTCSCARCRREYHLPAAYSLRRTRSCALKSTGALRSTRLAPLDR